LSAGVLRVLRRFAGHDARLRLHLHQFSFGQRSAKSRPAQTFSLSAPAGDRRAVLEQHEGDVLIMGAVDAIGEIARGVRDTDGRLRIKSDYQILTGVNHGYAI